MSCNVAVFKGYRCWIDGARLLVSCRVMRLKHIIAFQNSFGSLIILFNIAEGVNLTDEAGQLLMHDDSGVRTLISFWFTILRACSESYGVSSYKSYFLARQLKPSFADPPNPFLIIKIEVLLVRCNLDFGCPIIITPQAATKHEDSLTACFPCPWGYPKMLLRSYTLGCVIHKDGR